MKCLLNKATMYYALGNRVDLQIEHVE